LFTFLFLLVAAMLFVDGFACLFLVVAGAIAGVMAGTMA